MSDSNMMDEVARAADVPESVAMLVVEEFLKQLHKLEFERDKSKECFVTEMRFQISDRALYHLLGFIDSFSQEGDAWEPGTINEYLGRMPPCDRWVELCKEMKDWKKHNPN